MVKKRPCPLGAFYGQEAYLTRNSGILRFLATMPAGAFYGQEAEWKNGVGSYLAGKIDPSDTLSGSVIC